MDTVITVLLAIGLWLTAHGWNSGHLLAGFAGGLARALISTRGTFIERVFSGLTGSLFAVYITPLLAWFLGIPDPQVVNALAFTIGLIGLHLAEGLINLAKMYSRNPGKLSDLVREFVLRMFSKRD